MAKNVVAITIKKVGKLNRTSITPSLIAVFVLMVILFTSITPRFFSLQNFSVIFATLAISGIVSVGLTPVIISGVFDMSIGSIFGLTVVVVAKLFNIPNVAPPRSADVLLE